MQTIYRITSCTALHNKHTGLGGGGGGRGKNSVKNEIGHQYFGKYFGKGYRELTQK